MNRAIINIWTIFVTDLRRVVGNAISAIILVGLVLTPPMYAWFTTLGFWDPYSNTGDIEVAVANEDEGYQSDLLPSKIDVGSSIVSSLRANDSFKWQFVSETEAMEGVDSGRYYAALVIPKEFSRDLMGFLSGNARAGDITFYTNQKQNSIASTVTGTGASTIESDIDTAFTKTVIDVSFGAANDLSDYLDGEGVSNYGANLSESLDKSIQRLQTAASTTRTFSLLVQSASELTETTASVFEDVDASVVSAMPLVQKANGALSELDGSLSDITNAIHELDDILPYLKETSGFFTSGTDNGHWDVQDVIERLSKASSALERIRSSLGQDSESSAVRIQDIETESIQLANQLKSLGSDLSSLSQSLDATVSILDETSTSLSSTS